MDLRAFIFVPALVGSTLLGFVFLLFVANYFLAVLEGTAAGAKEIPWQSEQITDNFTKVWGLFASRGRPSEAPWSKMTPGRLRSRGTSDGPRLLLPPLLLRSPGGR